MENPAKVRLFNFQGDLLLELPLFSLGGHLYQYLHLMCQMRLMWILFFLSVTKMLHDFTLIKSDQPFLSKKTEEKKKGWAVH